MTGVQVPRGKAIIAATKRISLMRIKVTQSIVDYEAKPLLVNKPSSDGSPVLDENGRPPESPNTPELPHHGPDNKARTETEPVGAEEVAKRYRLPTKLDGSNEPDLRVSERALLLERVGKPNADVSGRIGADRGVDR